MTLEDIYNHYLNTPSDINEHLPVLKKYAEQSESITEMGVRWIVSTYAFLMGFPSKLTSIDIQHPSTWDANITLVEEIAGSQNCEFKFILGNTLEIEIEETDLLFLDTWHAYKQLKGELALHAGKVKKFIVLHDTTTYGHKDESSYESWGADWKAEDKGIWPAVEEFLEQNPEWSLAEKFENNNGLTILKRSYGTGNL